MASLMTSDEREDFPEGEAGLNTMIGKMVGFPKHIFCQGCGYGSIAANLVRIYVENKLEQEKYPFFVGVGCYSAIPTVLPGHSLMVLHGRGPAVATGAKLMRPDCKPVCIQGDGDALSIGTNHFIHAARRNVDMLVILLHNKIYGMTGGQTAPTTPIDSKTSTSPYGVVTNTIDAVELAKVCGATYVARWTWAQPRKYMKSILENLKEHKGFGLVEIVSSCVTYFGRRNDMAESVDLFNWIRSNTISIKDAEGMSKEELKDKIVTGVFTWDKNAPDYNAQYDKVLERAGWKK
ncbi:MAG: 2-oxoacid:ferredoxin oxidoreductase subunit beta [Candidatus Lokiarchaeota archaeon]|nr:2-oxoacid:ferredoxin oxidoreductase subunit beta [Candidatus Lokiarchaeota archaeon]